MTTKVSLVMSLDVQTPALFLEALDHFTDPVDVSQLRLAIVFCDAGASISIAQPGEQPVRRQREAARGGQISHAPWLLSLRSLPRTLLNYLSRCKIHIVSFGVLYCRL